MNRAERAVLIAEQLKTKNAAAGVCIVLGSGWNGVTDFLQDKKIIKYADLGGMPQCGVEGHEGNFVFGTVGECKVAAMQGRFHYYEGRSMDDIAVPLEALYVSYQLYGAKSAYRHKSRGKKTDFYRLEQALRRRIV